MSPFQSSLQTLSIYPSLTHPFPFQNPRPNPPFIHPSTFLSLTRSPSSTLPFLNLQPANHLRTPGYAIKTYTPDICLPSTLNTKVRRVLCRGEKVNNIKESRFGRESNVYILSWAKVCSHSLPASIILTIIQHTYTTFIILDDDRRGRKGREGWGYKQGRRMRLGYPNKGHFGYYNEIQGCCRWCIELVTTNIHIPFNSPGDTTPAASFCMQAKFA